LTFSTRFERAQRARGHLRTENFEMLKMTWFVLSFNSLVILSNFNFWRAHTRASWPLCDLWWHDLLTLDLKYMWYEYEWSLLMHHEDMMDNVISQNGAWMTSRWPDDLEKVTVTSHDNDLWLCQNWTKLTQQILS